MVSIWPRKGGARQLAGSGWPRWRAVIADIVSVVARCYKREPRSLQDGPESRRSVPIALRILDRREISEIPVWRLLAAHPVDASKRTSMARDVRVSWDRLVIRAPRGDSAVAQCYKESDGNDLGQVRKRLTL